MFEGLESSAKDPRQSLHVQEVPVPELAPDEAYVAVLASSINFNTVWTSIFEPLPTFGFLDRLAKEGSGAPVTPSTTTWWARTPQGSCCERVRPCATGRPATRSRSTATTSTTRTLRLTTTRCWRPTSGSGASRSNFGGLADIAVVKANQLMPKPTHLSWEEAAINALCNSTAYRMLVSPNGARMTQGDKVLVWGASGGLGSYAVQHVLNGGGTPIGVVSSPEKVEAPQRPRGRGGHRPQGGQLPLLGRRAHPGRVGVATLRQGHPLLGRRGARDRVRAPGPPDHGSVGVRLQAGGDDRHLRRHVGLHDRVRQPPPLDEAQDDQGLPLRQLPRGLGRQPAHLRGQGRSRRSPPSIPSNRSARRPTRSTTTCTRARSACSAWPPSEGLGIDDPELRAKVGEDRITLFRRHGA